MRKMLNETTRGKVIEIWFSAAILGIAGEIALGPDVTVSAGIMLLALCLIPPAIVLRLWPAAPALAPHVDYQP